MELTKREKLIRRIDRHLRVTARQLIMFDTEEETLKFLIDSFQLDLNCDFVCILLNEDGYLIPKVFNGESDSFIENFPIKIRNNSSDLFEYPLAFSDSEVEKVHELSDVIRKEKIQSWFTVPYKGDYGVSGVCLIGFKDLVPLYQEMVLIFTDFGKDIAVAIKLAKQREEQKKIGMEWITESLSVNSPIEKTIGKIIERAGKGTQSKRACVYLYIEKDNSFILQETCFGQPLSLKRIVPQNNKLIDYFPYLAAWGGKALTVSLTMNLKTIGVLHVEEKETNNGIYTADDLQTLKLMAQHMAALIENIRLFESEKEYKQRLHMLLDYQQALVKETIEQDSFVGITNTISELFSSSVLLFDRFMRPIAHSMHPLDNADVQLLIEQATYQVFQGRNQEIWQASMGDTEKKLMIWPINHGGDLLGHLAIHLNQNDMDDFFKLSVNIARNIFYLQFIKQKLVFDTKEQVRDGFINKLLVPNLINEEEIIQYANVFNWNLFLPHRISVLSFNFGNKVESENGIIEFQEKKTMLFNRVREWITAFDKEILFATKGELFILIVPISIEKENPREFWTKLFTYIQKWSKTELAKPFYLGIGGKTAAIGDYFVSYQQAVESQNVIINQFKESNFVLYDDLGAYPLFHHLKNSTSTRLFIKKYLSPILNNSDDKNNTLFQTLRAYLNNNGSIKETSEELFIHRSTLQYRMEKIQSLLDIELTSSEQRFNLQLAFKLNDIIDL
ncbi:helix-turn-helix domain-containing protein [Peribacillus butanolivorans]|uniref:helix-turn-helix domain-containing protein n=1 Tax=Peribacillus butanolivorans TaxID=421767 RepID=UPI003669ACFE